MNFLSTLSNDVINLIKDLNSHGVNVCIVGGAVRDYFQNKKSYDLDFEIRNETLNLKDFFHRYSLKVKILPYEIYQFDFGEYNLEFSIPRVEIKKEGDNSHHYFDCLLDSKFTYEESFKRRDLTINAIGIELDALNNNETIIDPYNGRFDLNNQMLREVSDDFFADNVRLLRLVRMELKLNFHIAETLLEKLHLFDLSNLSLFHLKSEIVKSQNASLFIYRLKELCSDKNISISRDLNILFDLPLALDKKSVDDLYIDLILHADTQSVLKFAGIFSYSHNEAISLVNYFQVYNELRSKIDQSVELEYERDAKNLKIYFEKSNLREKLKLIELYDQFRFNAIKIDKELIDATPLEERSFLKIKEFFNW